VAAWSGGRGAQLGEGPGAARPRRRHRARRRQRNPRPAEFLEEVGLGYLTLDRAAPTLSGGEAQRIRLAAQLGSNLQGVCYVLDEPTIGLHPRDNQILLKALPTLGDKGNTLVVVEHDEDTIRRADHIIDIGPGAGKRGGRRGGPGHGGATGAGAGVDLTGQHAGPPDDAPAAGAPRGDQRVECAQADRVNAALHNLRKGTVPCRCIAWWP
jgi:excinuclease ABC subunit A